MEGFTEHKIPVVAVVGPTASGKTALGVALCQYYGGEAVSADSMQIYKGMDIATAKPSLAERKGVPHHLLDFVSPQEVFSVGRYVEEAKKAIAHIRKQGKLPVVVGGTGLYLDALLREGELPYFAEDPLYRKELEQLACEGQGARLYAKLQRVDPLLSQKINPADTKRIIRGLLAFGATGRPLSLLQKEQKGVPSSYQVCWIGLKAQNRQALYDRIDQRVDQMMAAGLLQEAQLAYEGGLSHTAAAAIGYKELFPFFRGEITLLEAVEQLKRGSRRYCKRQLTWFRRWDDIDWILIDQEADFDTLFHHACAIVEKSGLVF